MNYACYNRDVTFSYLYAVMIDDWKMVKRQMKIIYVYNANMWSVFADWNVNDISDERVTIAIIKCTERFVSS